MQRNFYLSLVLMTLLSFIIIPGCGGGSNSINPTSSIITPTPAIFNNAVGYLTINIVWPQSGIQGKCSISSENNEKDITASMPVDTSLIYIKIRDANEPNTNITLDPNGLYTFHRSPGEDTKTAIMGPFPVIKVKVRSEAYDSQNSTPISVAEQEFQIKPGQPEDNTVDLALGDYYINLYPKRGAGFIAFDAWIDTNLSIVYPTPTGNPAPAPSPRNVEGKKIKYTVDSVTYTGSEFLSVDPNDIYVTQEGLTDENGNCMAGINTDKKPVRATIKATLEGTNVVSFCTFDIRDLFDLSINSSMEKIVAEDGQCKITAYLLPKSDEEPPYPYKGRRECPSGRINLSNKTVKFYIKSGSGSLSVTTASTGDDGTCETLFTASAMAGQVEIIAECDIGDQHLEATAGVQVVEKIIFQDDFEEPYKYQINLPPWEEYPWDWEYPRQLYDPSDHDYCYVDDKFGSKSVRLTNAYGEFQHLSIPPYGFSFKFRVEPGNLSVENVGGGITMNHNNGKWTDLLTRS
ncbi:MAG: hypothetical protein ABRQ39_32115 [Candidatus Eremiobacterota bacterium]